jgi:N-sulfoglucosamine sulfohydrolase
MKKIFLPRSLLTLVTLLVWSAAAAIAAESGPPAKRPNILWIVAENIGPDLGCYGHPLVHTPHLDRLAAQGMRYELAFATAPICSPSRSAFMTGMYQTTIGAHNHRGHRSPGLDDHFRLPTGVRPLPHRLRDAGYFTANISTIAGKFVGTGKTDLNFEVEGEVLRPQDKTPANAQRESVLHNFNNSVRLFQATEWNALPDHRPFYAQVNLPTVERGDGRGWVASAANPWYGQTHPARVDRSKVTLPPYYPDDAALREDWAGYLDAVGGVDTRVGEILARLERDGLADDTVVIFFGDNGRLEHRGLGWCYDSGDRVPLIVRWPKNLPAPPNYRAGSTSRQLISLLDLTATTLAIAGVPKPAGMQSRVFLGAQVDPAREVVFSARDRHDEAVQRIRAVRTARYRYVRNFMPERPFMALHRYKDARYPVVPLLRSLHAAGQLTGPPLALMAPRLPDEELYDTERDPHEIENLAGSSSPEHQRILRAMRGTLDTWIVETADQGHVPESPAVLAYWHDTMEKLFPSRTGLPRPAPAPSAPPRR